MTDDRDATEREAEPTHERLDAEGLPLDREPTLDDVRGSEGSGRTIAVGCSVAVAALILVFWLLRAYLLR